jgi:hypothetical protein
MHDIRTASDQDLNEFADLIAEQIRGRVIPRDMALGALHVAALELNRRHGNASLQTDFFGAAATLADFSQYCDQSDTIADQATLCAVRAAGCVIDLATDEEWEGLNWAGYTREGLTEFLYNIAFGEGRRRGFHHRPMQRATLVPADGALLLPPF